MAKNLAGLAALGALGVLYERMSRKQDGSKVPVVDRSTYPSENVSMQVGDDDRFSPRAEDPFIEPHGKTPSLDNISYYNLNNIASSPNSSSNRPSARPTSDKPSNANQPLVNYGQGRATQGPVQTTVQARPASSANIPGQSVQAPQDGEPVDNPSNMGMLLAGTGAGAGLAGIYKAKKAYDALKAADRSGVTNPNMWMAGPKGASKFGKSAKDLIKDKLMEKGLLKKELSEADTTGGASKFGYKKGGSIKAKSKPMKLALGGSARSSASKRGDGIASKGRTRGKMY
jgi:hypothetical protein